ncbi:MAG: hypothetical protein ACI8S3_001375 [Alphaproteobacteria bacterium]|jgi:hypothetical protein
MLTKDLCLRGGKTGFSSLLIAAVLTVLVVGAPAAAQDKTPSGTIEIEQVQVALFWSVNLGGGTLKHKGKTHDFTIGGLGYGGIGASTINATGEVFNLTEVKQIEGVYGQARYGYAAGTDSSGEIWMQNPNGVVIKLDAKRTGLALSLGADGVAIILD